MCKNKVGHDCIILDGEERGWMLRQGFTGYVRVKQVIYVTRTALAKKRSKKATNVAAK